jgi:hypothetical protein
MEVNIHKFFINILLFNDIFLHHVGVFYSVELWEDE